MTTAAPSKFEAILDQINTLQIRKQSLEAVVAQSFEDERHARINAIEADPSKRSDVGGARSDVGKIVGRRIDAENALKGLEEELSACGVVFQRLKAERENELLARIRDEVEELNDAERDHAGNLSSLLEAFLVGWNAYVNYCRERQNHVFVDGAHVDFAAGDEAMRAGRAPSLSPVPMDALGALEILIEATADPRNLGIREGNPVAFAGTALEGWKDATRDLRELYTVNMLPPAGRPRYSSQNSGGAHQGEGREAVYPQWRDSNGNLPGDNRSGRFGG